MPNASSLFHDTLLNKINDLIKLHVRFITGAQPKAGTGHKMKSISVVFSTLHCEGYIADLRYRWLIIRHFEKHEAWRTVNRKTIA